MASLDQEQLYAPKRTVVGDFADNPRIMGHDSVDIWTLGLGNQIPGTGNPNRGATLYCGQAYTSIEVVLEGQVGQGGTSIGDAGTPLATTTLNGIAAGSFLPLLVVQVQATDPSIDKVGNLVAIL